METSTLHLKSLAIWLRAEVKANTYHSSQGLRYQDPCKRNVLLLAHISCFDIIRQICNDVKNGWIFLYSTIRLSKCSLLVEKCFDYALRLLGLFIECQFFFSPSFAFQKMKYIYLRAITLILSPSFRRITFVLVLSTFVRSVPFSRMLTIDDRIQNLIILVLRFC